MSRSYRYPCWVAGYGTKWKKIAKRRANKHFRRLDHDEVQGGMWYKKSYCSWNICDWKWDDFRYEEEKRFNINGNLTKEGFNDYTQEYFTYEDYWKVRRK